MATITRDMTFHEVMGKSPGCMGAQNETLAQGAIAHGLDVEELLTALNAIFD